MLTKLKKGLELSKTHQVTNNSYLATPLGAHLDVHPIVTAAVVGAVNADTVVGGSLSWVPPPT